MKIAFNKYCTQSHEKCTCTIGYKKVSATDMNPNIQNMKHIYIKLILKSIKRNTTQKLRKKCSQCVLFTTFIQFTLIQYKH